MVEKHGDSLIKRIIELAARLVDRGAALALSMQKKLRVFLPLRSVGGEGDQGGVGGFQAGVATGGENLFRIPTRMGFAVLSAMILSTAAITRGSVASVKTMRGIEPVP